MSIPNSPPRQRTFPGSRPTWGYGRRSARTARQEVFARESGIGEAKQPCGSLPLVEHDPLEPRRVYYVKVATRSSRASIKGSPRRAVAYITDNHDARRDPGCSDAELKYIARLGEGWKTELEGGRLPLVGFGILSDVRNQEELAARFEGACQPWHDRRGTTGYKSFTFTLPKELSLYGEGHREEAKSAMYAGIREALARGFPGKDIAAVAAIHTRNEAGEIHFHAHVLVGKFAYCRATRRTVSLNSQAGGNSGARVYDLKRAWKEAVDKEFERRVGVRVDQPGGFARPSLLLEDGTKVPPLNRESRRMLDKQLSPVYTETTQSGSAVRKVFRLSTAMDGRIFEVASGYGGEGWSAKGFLELAPDQARWLGRYEKRVETLKRIGYLTADGKITAAFRRHYSVHEGVDTPELQRMRLDLANHAAKWSARERRPVLVPSLWEAIDRYENIRRRVERLGVTREDLKRLHDEAQKKKPSPEVLRLIRKQLEREALRSPPKELPPLPKTRGVVAAYLGLQKAHVQALGVVVAGVFRLQYTKHRRIAAAIRAGASRDLFYAKERRIAQLGRTLRPLFWATRVILPRQTRRLELAIARLVALAKTQDLSRQWQSKFIAERKARLVAEAARLERPAQAPWRAKVDRARWAIPSQASEHNVGHLRAGLEFLRRTDPDAIAPLLAWADRLPEFSARVAAVVRGESPPIPPQTSAAALRAARIGARLEREEVSRHPPPPPAVTPAERTPQPLTRPERTPALPRQLDHDARLLAAGLEHDARLLAAGLEVFRQHRPERSATLEPWAGQLPELASRVRAVARGQVDQLPVKVYEDAIRAGRIGALLEREGGAGPAPVPAAFASHEAEIHRARARLEAFGQPDFLSREMLASLPRARIESALEEARQAGLLDAGTTWTLKGGTVRQLAERLLPTLKREMDRDRGLG
jgi:hypothetical protein